MKLQLSLNAKNLRNVAGLMKGTSDPFAVVSLLDDNNPGKAKVLGQTEVIKNSLSPSWVKKFPIEYDLGSRMKLIVSILDEVRKGSNKPMGSAVFEIGSLLGAKGNTKAVSISGGGIVYAKVQKMTSMGKFDFQLCGVKLKSTEGLFGTTDPFFEISRRDVGMKGTEWNVVYRSNVVQNSLNPNWQAGLLDIDTICGGDLDLPIMIAVYYYSKNGKHTPMGQVQTTTNGIVRAQNSNGFTLFRNTSGVGSKPVGNILVKKGSIIGLNDTNPTATSGPSVSSPSAPSLTVYPSFKVENTHNSGDAHVNRPHDSTSGQFTMGNTSMYTSQRYNASPTPQMNIAPSFKVETTAAFVSPASPPVSNEPSFIDYIVGGCEISLCVAIDFTGSNGDPRKPGTLHHFNTDGQKNDYEKAISAIGQILEHYDSDKKYPVWGFGAKYGGVVRHCFQCGTVPEVDGVDGILRAYHETFKSGLIMSGPTDITEVIQNASGFANHKQKTANAKGQQSYTILLILTDGAVSDIQKTANKLAEVSSSPLSIVIVGIGNADFSSMQFLDDFAERNSQLPDITQFVHFNTHRHDPDTLTAATLDEIPSQLTSYFLRNNIQPLPPVACQDEEIVVEPQEEEINLELNFDDDKVTVGNISGYQPAKVY